MLAAISFKIITIFFPQYSSGEIWRERKKRARRERGGAKEKFYAAKRPVQIWNINVDNIVISKLIKTKANSKYLIGYLDEAI